MTGRYLISVDVETAGPAPGRYALLSIGACAVDDPASAYSADLRPDRDGALPEALAVSGLSIDELRDEGLDPAVAMADFAAWVEVVTPEGLDPLFVGFNAPFDWMFVAEYFDRYLGRNPFGHAALDIKALAMGVHGISWAETSWRHLAPRHGVGTTLTHAALQDARDQAALVRTLLVQRGINSV